jgi:predicted nucleic acid-binding protein
VATKTDLWILDTSVVVAWQFPDEEGHGIARDVIRDVRSTPERYAVPHLFYSECANVLRRKLSHVVEEVRAAVDVLVRFGMPTFALSNDALLRMAELSCTPLGGYDATFVALAEDLGGRWLTVDTRAAKIADEHAVTLRGWARIKSRGG